MRCAVRPWHHHQAWWSRRAQAGARPRVPRCTHQDGHPACETRPRADRRATGLRRPRCMRHMPVCGVPRCLLRAPRLRCHHRGQRPWETVGASCDHRVPRDRPDGQRPLRFSYRCREKGVAIRVAGISKAFCEHAPCMTGPMRGRQAWPHAGLPLIQIPSPRACPGAADAVSGTFGRHARPHTHAPRLSQKALGA